MNDVDDLERRDAELLGTLMHDRVSHLDPHLDRRATSAIRAGVRRKRRTYAVSAAASLGGVAAAALLVAQLGSASPANVDPNSLAPAAAPSASPFADPGSLSCEEIKQLLDPGKEGRTLEAPTAKALIALRHLKSCGEGTDGPIAPQELPVTLNAPGWTCWPAADDKFSCTSAGASLLITVRPAEHHDSYLNDPDKSSPGVHVTDVHDGHFATMEAFGGQTDSVDLDELATSLVWK